MAVSMQATVSGLEQAQGALDAMRKLGLSPRPIWQAIGAYGENSTRLRFVKQVGPDGQPWAMSLRVRKQGGKTLVLSTRLLRSVTHVADRNGAEWGTNVKYGAIHQFGGDIKRNAFSGWARLRTNAKGQLLRQESHSNLSVFAKAHHKRVVERRYTVDAHVIKMPARPYLGVNDADGREFERLSVEVIKQAVLNRGSR